MALRQVVAGHALVFAGCLFVAKGVASESCQAPQRLVSALRNSTRGNIVNISGLAMNRCPELPLSGTWSGGALIFSDSPESPSMRGVLYRDATLAATTAATPNRIFVYHVNGRAMGPMTFAMVLTNLGAKTGILSVSRHGVAEPSRDYIDCGRTAFERFLNSSLGNEIAVPAGATVEIDKRFDLIRESPQDLAHGIWGYQFNQRHQITICSLFPGDDPVTVCPNLNVLARDQDHARGTFPHSDRIYRSKIGLLSSMQQVRLGGNTTADPDAQGIDRTDGSPMRLRGNYGILYRMNFVGSSSMHDFALLISPLGGAWGGVIELLRENQRRDVIRMPSQASSIESSTEAVIGGTYGLTNGAGISLRWMPCGGSSFPVRLVAVSY
ncbi:MAG: hypothetical protein JOZ62_22795 [Acidobacteriaceae bacterium]|nr:hypothetical protein [Acidobacteriaceae bacterium]